MSSYFFLAAVLLHTARDQAASLEPASVRAQIADAEAARCRGEDAAVTAQEVNTWRQRLGTGVSRLRPGMPPSLRGTDLP